MQYQLIKTAEELAELEPFEDVEPLAIAPFQLHAPDAHWVVHRDQRVMARASIWWNQVPAYPGQQVGVIGHYAAHGEAAGVMVLQKAVEELRSHHCTLIVGPMDGNTWRRYRLVSDRSSEPPFFLEPENPTPWNQHFLAAGFQPFATYSSALNPDLSQRDERMASVGQRLERQGVKVRSLDPTQFERELQRIYHLSLISFQRNLLYSPITETEFLTQYAQVKPYVQPDLVLLAEQDETLVGYLFAIPDLLQAQRGEAITTVIVKTVAVLPGRAYAGLGSYLVDQGQAIAHRLGYTRAIHALMHDSNTSRNISDRFAQTIRRYTLYGHLQVAVL